MKGRFLLLFALTVVIASLVSCEKKDETPEIETQILIEKTISTTAGNLLADIPTSERSTISKLTITGTIDARDFAYIRDYLYNLSILDLSGASIVAYSGNYGSSGLIKSYVANEIPANAFLPKNGTYLKNLNTITLPTSVQSIGEYAFYGCMNLSTINNFELITTIGEKAFEMCGITSLTISASVKSISSYAFAYCEKLTSLTINEGIKIIPDDIFQGCKSLITVKLPSTLTDINSGAFYGCRSLSNINIPISVKQIKLKAFSNCAGPFIVDTNNNYYSSENGILYNKDKSILINGGNLLTVLEIPNTVKTINGYAFENNNNLLSVNLSSVDTISQVAFSGCSNLSSVNFGSSLKSIEAGAFTNCTKLLSVNFPASLTTIGYRSFENCDALTFVLIPQSVTEISIGAFFNCTDLVDVEILANVEEIEISTFAECTKLSSIKLPNSLRKISNSVFSSCINLKTITLPSSLTQIGDNAFEKCAQLVTIKVQCATPAKLFAYYNQFPTSFKGLNTISCTLYVPTGSKAAYQAANGWKDFTNIVEF